MAQITVMEKPDWISYDEIADVLHDAHKENLSRGLDYSAAIQSGEEIEALLHDNGRFYVALADGKKVVGVSAIRLREKSFRWFGQKKPYGKVMLEGVRPEYQGLGINSMLRKEIYDYAYQYVDFLELDTAEKNTKAIAINKKHGWIPVDYITRKTNHFYSVVMARWKDGCPYSVLDCQLHFLKNKMIIRRKYKSDGQPR